MKYFIDTEFHEYKHRGFSNTIELISIGIVAEDGRELYCISREFGWLDAYQNEWLRLNVIKPIYEEMTGDFSLEEDWKRADRQFHLLNSFSDPVREKGKTVEQIRDEVIAFVGSDPNPQFYGYYCDYDWVVFCWLFGRMIDLPKGFPMYCRDLKQTLDERVDARHLRELHGRGHSTFDLKTCKELPEYPKQDNEHNALADARWNRDLYHFVQGL